MCQDSPSSPTITIAVLITCPCTTDGLPNFNRVAHWSLRGAAVLSRAEGDKTRILNHVAGDEARPLQRGSPPSTDSIVRAPSLSAARGQEGSQLSIDHLDSKY